MISWFVRVVGRLTGTAPLTSNAWATSRDVGGGSTDNTGIAFLGGSSRTTMGLTTAAGLFAFSLSALALFV